MITYIRRSSSSSSLFCRCHPHPCSGGGGSGHGGGAHVVLADVLQDPPAAGAYERVQPWGQAASPAATRVALGLRAGSRTMFFLGARGRAGHTSVVQTFEPTRVAVQAAPR